MCNNVPINTNLLYSSPASTSSLRGASVTTEFTNVSYMPDGDDMEAEEQRLRGRGGATLSSAPAELLGIGRSASTPALVHVPAKLHITACEVEGEGEGDNERHMNHQQEQQMESFRSAPRTFVARFGTHRSYSPQLTRIALSSGIFTGAGSGGAGGMGTYSSNVLGKDSVTGTKIEAIQLPIVPVTCAPYVKGACADTGNPIKEISSNAGKTKSSVRQGSELTHFTPSATQERPSLRVTSCTRRILAPKVNEMLLPSSSLFGALYFNNS